MTNNTNDMIDMCCESMPAWADTADKTWDEPQIPQQVTFGYPRTTEELEAAVDKAYAERHDPSKWITHDAFMARLKHNHPWLS